MPKNQLLIQTQRDDKFLSVDRIVIRINDVDFRLSLNNFGELLVNKHNNGDGESSIVILPNVSNEIRLK